MQVLSALTPPLLVCAVVVIAIAAFLRHEMGRPHAGRSGRRDQGEATAASTADPDNRQTKLTDASRPSADDSGPASRRLP